MAEVNIAGWYEPYIYRNPRTGQTSIHLRVRHNRLTSQRAKDFRACVASDLRGLTFRGHGSAEDEREVHAAMTAAAKTCAKQV